MPLRGGKMNLVVLSWLGVACGVHRPPEATERADPLTEVRGFAATVADRGATLPASDPWDPTPTHVRYLDQGWGPVETLWYYYADQGSRLVRRDVLMHLEAADGQGPFVSDATFTRFRFLTQARTPNNPDGLPVGVTRDGAYVGLTCAACHTGQIVYGDAAIRVDGAPALIDLIGFIDALEASVRATLSNPDRLARFVAAVDAASADDQAAARLELERALAFLDSYSANFEQVAGGFGRIDAIGGIIAQVVRDTSGSGHAPPANAPASYPLLWDAPRHDYVQWAGFSSNAGPGSLARNVGEVVGVFGEVHVTAAHDARENKAGFDTSVQAHALVDMEEVLWRLQSPVWPEDLLPPIDRAKAERGAALYQERCVSCHAVLDRDDPKRRVTAQIVGLDKVGTDPRTALNLVEAVAPAGVLEGSLTPEGTGFYRREASALELLGGLVAGTLKRDPVAVLRAVTNGRLWGIASSPKQGDHAADSEADPVASLRAYKARPLNGAWASAPYLHNGSVPTLYDLLLPEDQRPARFAVGRREYDPEKVGFRYDGDAPWVLDTAIPGNRNTGHRYGTDLTEADRLALLEHLKTL